MKMGKETSWGMEYYDTTKYRYKQCKLQYDDGSVETAFTLVQFAEVGKYLKVERLHCDPKYCTVLEVYDNSETELSELEIMNPNSITNEDVRNNEILSRVQQGK